MGVAPQQIGAARAGGHAVGRDRSALSQTLLVEEAALRAVDRSPVLLQDLRVIGDQALARLTGHRAAGNAVSGNYQTYPEQSRHSAEKDKRVRPSQRPLDE